MREENDELLDRRDSCENMIREFSMLQAILRGLPYRIQDIVRHNEGKLSDDPAALEEILKYVAILKEAQRLNVSIEIEEAITMARIEAKMIKVH